MKYAVGTTVVIFLLLLTAVLSTVIPQLVYQMTHLLP